MAHSDNSEINAAPHLSGGLRRLKSILYPVGPIPVGKSTWWAGVKSGRFPKPWCKLGPRITVWREEDILKLVTHGVPPCTDHRARK
jgi:hypothetical protein